MNKYIHIFLLYVVSLICLYSQAFSSETLSKDEILLANGLGVFGIMLSFVLLFISSLFQEYKEFKIQNQNKNQK